MPQDNERKPTDTTPANRLSIDYRDVPARKTTGPIIDAHTHIKDAESAKLFFEAADTYGIGDVVSMTPLKNVNVLREIYADRLRFIAIPNWEKQDATEAFRASWIDDLTTFRERGARVCKFWVAPYLRGKYGLTLTHEFLRPVVEHALELGYDFMIHVADPTLWWAAGGKYEDTAKFGTKSEQYEQLEWLLAWAAPRFVIGAHMAGNVEDPGFLAGLLERHANLYLDSSATKWMVREVSNNPAAVRDLIVAFPDRILFGSDLVSDPKYDTFDHYASRYWAQLRLWETACDGESPIEDPDAADPPRLVGIDLPEDVLRKMYFENARRLYYES